MTDFRIMLAEKYRPSSVEFTPLKVNKHLFHVKFFKKLVSGEDFATNPLTSRIKTIELICCRIIKEEGLGHLEELETLILKKSHIPQIPPIIKNLKNLKTLIIDECVINVKKIPPLPENLEKVKIVHSHIEDIEEPLFSNIDIILTDNAITYLPSWFFFYKGKINIEGNYLRSFQNLPFDQLSKLIKRLWKWKGNDRRWFILDVLDEKEQKLYDDALVIRTEHTIKRLYYYVNASVIDAALLYEEFSPRELVDMIHVLPNDTLIFLYERFYPTPVHALFSEELSHRTIQNKNRSKFIL